MQAITEWHDIDAERFYHEIVLANQPAVLRGLVNSWPAVARAKQGAGSVVNYLQSCDAGAVTEVFLAPSSVEGRFWYGSQMQGYNFEKKMLSISDATEQLIAQAQQTMAPSIYLGAIDVYDKLPQFARDNICPLLTEAVRPRLWIGSAVTVQTHFDISYNLACVVAGQRTFTLFPPSQLANLYVGPLDFTMAGQPISMVPLDHPDLEKYPKFTQALAAASTATLEPGDAIYIPYMWWHHVKSHNPVNVMVNYWWDKKIPGTGSPFEAMIHSIMAVASLEEDQREIWRDFFNHYVFKQNGEPAAHLEQRERGVLQNMSPSLAQYIKHWLAKCLSR